MTTDEAKRAFMDECPVEHNGITYERITAIIYRKNAKGVSVQAELLDKCGHSVSIVAPERLTRRTSHATT